MKKNNKNNKEQSNAMNIVLTNANKLPRVIIADYNAKQFEPMTEFSAGLWAVFAQGTKKIAQHYTGEMYIPATAAESDVFASVFAFKKYVDAKRCEEIELQKLNPDIKSRFKSSRLVEFFAVTADGQMIRAYDYETSDWADTGLFQKNRTYKTAKEKKMDQLKAAKATMCLFGYHKSVKALESEQAKAEKEKKATAGTPTPPAPLAPETERTAA